MFVVKGPSNLEPSAQASSQTTTETTAGSPTAQGRLTQLSLLNMLTSMCYLEVPHKNDNL